MAAAFSEFSGIVSCTKAMASPIRPCPANAWASSAGVCRTVLRVHGQYLAELDLGFRIFFLGASSAVAQVFACHGVLAGDCQGMAEESLAIGPVADLEVRDDEIAARICTAGPASTIRSFASGPGSHLARSPTAHTNARKMPMDGM